MPFTYTLVLWSVIYIVVTSLMYLYLKKYLIVYFIAQIIPLILTLRTKNIE